MLKVARRPTDVVLFIFFISGLCGLIYESVWAHYVKLMLGHAAYAQTLVLVVFIGGLALGSWLCARVAERIRNPLMGYALIEGAIGLFALAFHWIFNRAMDWSYDMLLPAACEQATGRPFGEQHTLPPQVATELGQFWPLRAHPYCVEQMYWAVIPPQTPEPVQAHIP